MIAGVGQAAAVSFLSKSHDALLADRQANEALLLRDVTGAAVRVPLAGGAQGISGPVAIEASEDNKRVFVADSGGSGVSILELQTGTVKHFSTAGSVSGLHRLRGDSVFRLTDFSGNPLLLLDAGAAESRIVFVPSSQRSAQNDGGLVLPDRGSPRPLRVRDRKRQSD
jgi:DNA-binding beta-propeller fold protein YncE